MNILTDNRYIYSKTYVKKIGFQDQLSLNAGQKHYRMLQNFRPSLSLHLTFRSLFCLFFLSGRFTHVLLYVCGKQTTFVFLKIKVVRRLSLLIGGVKMGSKILDLFFALVIIFCR